MATITINDIIEIAEDFNKNIPDRLITPHIKKARDIDFVGVLPDSLLNDIEQLDLTSTTKPELIAFFNKHFKVCWVYRFYSRFLAKHGRTITASGIVSLTDTNETAITSEERTLDVARNDRDASVYFTKMINAFNQEPTLDGVTYIKDDTYKGANKTKKFSIRPIGK